MVAFPPLPLPSSDGSITCRQLIGPGESLHWAAAAAARLVKYVRMFGTLTAEGRYEVEPATLRNLWDQMTIFASLPTTVFFASMTSAEQHQLDTSGIVMRRGVVGPGGVPDDIHAACNELMFALADPADRISVPRERVDRLSDISSLLEGLATHYGPTIPPDAATELLDLEHLFQDEQFDRAGLHLALLVKPLGTSEHTLDHGLGSMPDPDTPAEVEPKPRIMLMSIGGEPGDPQMKAIGWGRAEAVTAWMRDPSSGVQVRLFMFGERQHREAFLALASRAGSLLPSLPPRCISKLGGQRIEALDLSLNPAFRWMLALFPLAWRLGDAAKYRVWRGAVDNGRPYTLSLDPAHLRGTIAVQQNNSQGLKGYFARLPVPPDDFIAVVRDDLYAASARACGVLRNLAAPPPTRHPPEHPPRQEDAAVTQPALTPNEQAIWDALEGRAMTGGQLKDYGCGKSAEQVANDIASIRLKRGKETIRNDRNGRGYWRSDAAPSPTLNVPRRRRPVRPT